MQSIAETDFIKAWSGILADQTEAEKISFVFCCKYQGNDLPGSGTGP
jgi:hypothetical protein